MRRAIAGAAILAACAALPCAAGTGSGQFAVNVSLSTIANGGPGTAVPASGLCVSQSASGQTGAIVRVACQTGQFVSIRPLPGGRFVDTHGGAYAYYFGSRSSGPIEVGEWGTGDSLGTVASLRVYAGEGAGVLNMLVSF